MALVCTVRCVSVVTRDTEQWYLCVLCTVRCVCVETRDN